MSKFSLGYSNYSDLKFLPKKRVFEPQIANSIVSACNSNFRDMGFTFFEHLRVYNDGSCYRICPNLGLIDYVFENKTHITAIIPDTLIKDRFFYLVPKNSIYQQIFRDWHEMFNIDNAILLLNVCPDYYEQFTFGWPENNNKCLNYYINEIDLLWNLSYRLKDRISDVVQLALDDRITLPKSMLSNLRGYEKKCENDFYPQSVTRKVTSDLAIDQKLNHLPTHLSKREKECIKFLFLGLTAKETAKKLGLSQRTVEFYFDNIKSKLGCFRKIEILRYLSDL